MPVTQALQSGLAEVEAATTDTAHALMQTFLWSRKGPNDEDLMELLSFPSEQGGGWFRFPYRSPNTLQASQPETAFHGTHMECLHGLMATGRIMPSNDKVAGMRHFDGRQGVYLHKPSNKHLAQGYAAFIRYGPKHVYLRALCEVEVDPTNQFIFEYDSLRICAFHLQIATKSELKHGDYLREWAGTLEVPLSAALEAFQALGLGLGQVETAGGSLPSSTNIMAGGVTGEGVVLIYCSSSSFRGGAGCDLTMDGGARLVGEVQHGYSGSSVPVFRQCLESTSRVPSTWTPSSSDSHKCRLGSLGGPPELASHLQAAYNSRRFVGDCAQ